MSKEINLPNMFVVIDSDEFPMFPTVATTEEDSKNRMVKLAGRMDWDYYERKGYKVQKVTVIIKKEETKNVKAIAKRGIFLPKRNLGIENVVEEGEELNGELKDGFFFPNGKGGIGISEEWIEIIDEEN